MKKPLIMGMGVTGRSISRYLSNQSTHHLVMDSCSSKNINLTSYVDKFLFSEDASILKEVSKVFVSPGVDSNNIFLNETIKRKIPISLDTRKSKIMGKGINLGVKLINDVSGLEFDSQTLNILKKYKVPFVIQHSQGTPENMQKNIDLTNGLIFSQEVLLLLIKKQWFLLR